MPTLDKILQENTQVTPLYNVQKYVTSLSAITNRPVFAYITAHSIKPSPTPESQSINDADMQGFMTCMKGMPKYDEDSKLDFIIHSPGGSAEATKRLISYIRKLFPYIRVFVPHLAMSGGTMLALASDEIWMGPYSSLGPTDPQVPLGDRFVPAGAIVQEFEKAYEDVTKNEKLATLWAERLKDLPLGMLKAVTNFREHAQKDTKDLLMRYMFKGKEGAQEKADAISKHLNAFDEHSHHGKGINIDKAKELGLVVKDLSADKVIEDAVLSIYHAATIVFRTTPAHKVFINSRGTAIYF